METEPIRSVDAVRQDIDEIDASLVELLNRRVSLAQEIGRLKGADGKPFFTPERERQVFEKLGAANHGPLQASQLQGIFREIISAARAAEKPLAISYWGPAGTFTHLAALQTFGSASTFVPADSITEVFQAVEHGEADYGVVPVENSVAGIVPETLDNFPITNIKICAEAYLMVHHHLATTASSLDSIERVYAGTQPWQQCRNWLRAHLPKAEIVDSTPTARAAEEALRDPRGAAIANRLGAEAVGIPVLVENIHDNPNNRTRFLVVGHNEPSKTGRDKTSLLFNLRNKPGQLYHALGAFNAHDVNLMMIESRPAPRSAFEYIFYVDCAGHRSDDNLQAALRALQSNALETVVLGSYPSMDEAGKL